MPQNAFVWRKLGWPVYLALALLVIVTAALVIAVVASQRTPSQMPEAVSADSYGARVDALLAIAHPENAEAVVQKYACVVCHREGGSNSVGPSWVGLAERAKTRRPPMPAAAYIYESIVYPSAYVVDGYTDLMPKDFAERLSDQELADVIAYLLTPDAH